MAWVLIFVDVESVVVTGPIIVIAGVVMIVCGCKVHFWAAAVIGVMHVSIALLYVSLVNLLGWGPDEAKLPFMQMGAVYLAIITPWSLWAWRCRPAMYQPWQCQACGYALFGLRQNRCPECGRPFDPALVTQVNVANVVVNEA